MQLSNAVAPRHLKRAMIAALVASFALSACGSSGGFATAPFVAAHPTATANANATPIGTTPQAGAVDLPTGSTLSPTSLQATNSVGAAPIASNGTFTIGAFTGGPQFTAITGATGAPLMLGFVGTGQTHVSALTTAEVLVFYAADLYTVPEPQRDAALASLATLPGIGTVQQAISAAIVANPASENIATDPTIAAAVQTLLGAIAASSAMRLPAAAGLAHVHSQQTRKREEVGVAPNATESGITLGIDFPDGIDFYNTDRRVAQAFVDEVSHVPAGSTQTVADQQPDTNAPIAIAAETGLNGTFGAISDYFGSNIAYTPTDTSPLLTPNIAGASKTNYRVMIVGPGALAGSSASLTPLEANAQATTSETFMITDVFLPFVASIALPVNAVIAPSSVAGAALASIVNGLSAVPTFATAATAGDVRGALAAAVTTIASDSNLQNSVIALVLAFGGPSAAGYGVAKYVGKFFTSFATPLDLALTSIDKVKIASDLANANRADLFTVSVVSAKVSLTPATPTLSNFDSVTLTTNVSNALQLAAGETLNYLYTCAGGNGRIADGQSTATCGTSNNSFTSTSPTVLYIANATGSGTDTVTSAVIEVSGGVTKTNVGTGQAMVAVGAPTLALTPPATILNGATLPLTATLTIPGSPPPGTIAYKWTSTAHAGTLDDPNSSATNAFTTTSATANYIASQNGIGQDTITVQAVLSNGGTVTNLGSSASTTVTISATNVRIQPFTQNVGDGGTVQLYAAIQTGVGNLPVGTLTYKWQNTATTPAGSLVNPDTGAKSNAFTTSQAVISYTANAAGTGTDPITVSVTLTNGSQQQNLGSPPVPATVTVIGASPSPSPSPGGNVTLLNLGAFTIPCGTPCYGTAPPVLSETVNGDTFEGGELNVTQVIQYSDNGGPLITYTHTLSLLTDTLVKDVSTGTGPYIASYYASANGGALHPYGLTGNFATETITPTPPRNFYVQNWCGSECTISFLFPDATTSGAFTTTITSYLNTLEQNIPFIHTNAKRPRRPATGRMR